MQVSRKINSNLAFHISVAPLKFTDNRKIKRKIKLNQLWILHLLGSNKQEKSGKSQSISAESSTRTANTFYHFLHFSLF